jgi:hypothetical protein
MKSVDAVADDVYIWIALDAGKWVGAASQTLAVGCCDSVLQ